MNYYQPEKHCLPLNSIDGNSDWSIARREFLKKHSFYPSVTEIVIRRINEVHSYYNPLNKWFVY